MSYPITDRARYSDNFLAYWRSRAVLMLDEALADERRVKGERVKGNQAEIDNHRSVLAMLDREIERRKGEA